MSPADAVILGIVEGITEFLPISSTGHLILATNLIGIPNTEFVKSFIIAIQLGAILSVVVLYARQLLVERETIKRIVAAFVPTAIIGLVLYKSIKTYLMSDTVVVISLILGGVGIILLERWFGKREGGTVTIRSMTYRQAVLIGCAQSIAVIPGVSRAAATILGGRALGISRTAIVEFSFLLAVPTMAAATGLDLMKSAYAFTGEEYRMLGVGFITSYFIAIAAIRWLLRYIETHDFTAFGIYRIVVALLFWFVANS